MFAKKDTTIINSILGSGSDFQGDFVAQGSARIDGNVNGNVKITGSLIVGAKGKVSGDVESAVAIIGGEVLGDVVATDKIELTATAKVLGDLATKVIVIDEHAIFQGRCDMNQEAPSKRKNKAAVNRALREGKKTAKSAIQEALKVMQEAEQQDEIDHASEMNSKKSPTEGIVAEVVEQNS